MTKKEEPDMSEKWVSEKEEYFIRTFVRKERKERLLGEFSDTRKRSRGLDRFCHASSELLSPARIKAKGIQDVKSEALSYGNIAVAVISPFSDLDKQVMQLTEAIEEAEKCPDAAILIGEGFAVVFGEPMKGSREVFLLTEEMK